MKIEERTLFWAGFGQHRRLMGHEPRERPDLRNMVLKIRSEQLQIIQRHAEADYPAECCGILLGQVDGDSKEVSEVAPIPNLRHDPARAEELLPLDDPGHESERNRFLIDPREQLRVEKDARARTLTVLGYYHSHPDHPARPSGYDREHAWPWYSYVIVSVEQGRARDTRSWALHDDRAGFEPEPLELEESLSAARRQEG